MMMMDMGMYGTYGKPDSYYNFQSTNHQLSSGSGGSIAGHATVSQSPDLTINHHYYPQTAVAPFTTSSNDVYLTPESASSGPAPSQTFYSPSGAVLHDDGTAIISSENGLSYTNLDYSNYANNQQQQQNLSCHSNEQHNQTFQIQDVGYRDDNRGATSASSTSAATIIHQQSLTIGQIPIHIRTDHQQQLSHHNNHSQHHHHHHHQHHQHQHLHQSSHHSSSEYQILPTTSSNYLNHNPSEVDPALHYSAQTSMTLRQTAEYTIHPTAHYKEECTDLTGYRASSLQQSTHSVHTPVHEHHQQHRQAQGHALGVQQNQQQPQHTQVPTYKWMQVKRNVPKPV
ncbi:hypothetical protein PV327_011293, partial [Microctonus hyperodae]